MVSLECVLANQVGVEYSDIQSHYPSCWFYSDDKIKGAVCRIWIPSPNVFAKNNYVYLFSLNHIHFKLHLNMEHEDTEKIFRSGEFVGTESLYKFGVISPYLEPVGSYGEISCPDSVTARNGQTFSRWYSPQQPRWHGRKGDGPVITLHGSWDR